MSKFIVSARKYRPQRFDEVVGQQNVSNTLKNALKSGHLAHAFLFCGPRGVGKTTCARILAKVLNCENRTPDFEACNTCSSCVSFNDNASFNITELDAASNNSVEHIRALIEQVRFQPQKGRYKVFIIDEVHMLSQQAFNAFLKTLEEPPSYAIFILATTEKHKIIPTILSRCQIFDFRRIQVSDIAKHLKGICDKEGIQAETDALQIIAQKADGALRDALSIFDRITSFSGKQITYQDVIDNLNLLDYDYYFRIVDALLSEDYPTCLLLLDEIIKKGFEPDLFVSGLAGHFRDLLVSQEPHTLTLLEVGKELEERYKTQAMLAPRQFILNALQLAHDCDINYKTAVNKRLHVEIALLKMSYLKRMSNGAIVQQTSEEEKKTPDLSKGKKIPPVLEKKEAVISSPTPKKQPPSQKKEEKSVSKDKFGLKESKHSEHKFVSIKKLAANFNKDKEADKEKEEGPISLEEVQKAWNNYAINIQSPSAKNALQRAVLSLDGEKLIIEVSSKVFANLIREERDLIDILRASIQRPKLVLELKINQELTNNINIKKPAKPLTNKEKYEKMMEQNPLLQEMRKRFDLRLDND